MISSSPCLPYHQLTVTFQIAVVFLICGKCYPALLGVLDSICHISETPQLFEMSLLTGDKEGKEMKKSFTTSQVKMITRTIIDKRFEM